MKENDNNLEGIQDTSDLEEFLDTSDPRMQFEVKRALLEDTTAPDADQAFQEFKRRNHLTAHRRKLWISISSLAAAACIAALLLLAPWKNVETSVTPQANHLELAKMGNVVYQIPEERQYISISMGDKVVDLSDKASAKDAGIIVTHDNLIQVFDRQTDNHEDVTISVPSGKTAKVMLDDGTQVNLNAGSHLTFPHHFRESGMREVKLYGEAFFEVKHDETRPFVVNTEEMNTKVLGTKFNVRYFKHESCRVSLTEGSVEVKNSNSDVYLKPDETAWLRNGKLEVENTDNDITMSWLHGEFYFDGQTLGEIMTEIGRWYNLNVVFANEKPLHEQLHFSANRTASIHEIVRQLQLIGNVNIQLKDKEHVLLIK